MNSSKQFKDMCIFTEEFIKRISHLTDIKSRTGIEYIVLSVSKERIHIKRLSTENTADLDTHALYRAYITENSNTLKTLKNATIRKKYGLFMAQSPAWAILNAMYRDEQKQSANKTH